MITNTPWTPTIITLALAQFGMSSDPSENLEKALSYIKQAGQQGADIVCLPELFRSPYFCLQEKSERDYAERSLDGIVGALSEAAKAYQVAIIGGSVYEQAVDGRRFNTALVIHKSGELLGSYRKTHIPHDPGFYECNYFEPGDSGYKVFDLGCAKVSVLICYDQWFPEAARSCALQGAEIIFYPTAIGTTTLSSEVEGDWHNAWETVQRGHAIANSIIVAAVNRVGHESHGTEAHSDFWGGSFVSDGFGTLVAKGGDQEQLLIAKVDLEHSRFTRESWRFMHSRRPETYGEVVKK
jgi:predicted amidohydrolase